MEIRREGVEPTVWLRAEIHSLHGLPASSSSLEDPVNEKKKKKKKRLRKLGVVLNKGSRPGVPCFSRVCAPCASRMNRTMCCWLDLGEFRECRGLLIAGVVVPGGKDVIGERANGTVRSRAGRESHVLDSFVTQKLHSRVLRKQCSMDGVSYAIEEIYPCRKFSLV
jgi:hypothetical protein